MSPWRRELAVASALCVVAVLIGAGYVRTVIAAGGKPRFYQNEFGAAAMLACGRGYANPDEASVPALHAFLRVERDRMSCEEIPGSTRTVGLTPMQRAFRYQESAVAATWRLFGLSWSGLAPLYGVFFGATILAAYGLFRTGMNRVLAACAALALVVSTVHLGYLPHLRDYSKAPFILTLLLILAWLVKGQLSAARVLTLSVLYGAVLGLGMGFRNDLLIAVPPFMLVVALFLPVGVRERIGLKVTGMAVCLLTLYGAMYPMRSIYATGGGNSMQHVVALGLVEPFNDALGVNNGRLYEWGYDFKDAYAHAIISSYATRTKGTDSALEMYGPDYDRAGTAYLADVALNFPADMLVRVYASALTVMATPYSSTSLQPPTWITNATVVRVYHLRERVLRSLGALWPWLTLAVLVGLTLADPRVGICVLVVAFYFAAYPVLQFSERHFFHLEFMSWWTLGVAVQFAVDRVAALRGSSKAPRAKGRAGRTWGASLRTAVLVWLAAGVIVFAPLWVLRWYQQRHVSTLLARYVALSREPLDRTTSVVRPGLVSIDSPGRGDVMPGVSTYAVRSEYVVAEFAAGACDAFKFDMMFRYRASAPEVDFSRSIQVRPPTATGSVSRLFFPAYFHHASTALDNDYGLAAIELPEVARPCLTGLARVRDVQHEPLLLDLRLPPGWERATLFDTIDGLEHRSNGEEQEDVYTWPENLPVSRRLLRQPVERLAAADIAKRSATLNTDGDRWTVDGTGGVGGRGPFLYLAQMKPRFAAAGSVVVASGRVRSGGLSVGLVRDGAWVMQVPVLAAGPFVVVIRVPDAGSYAVTVANNLPGRSLDNHLTIDRIGWVAP